MCGPTEFHLFTSAGAASGASTQMVVAPDNCPSEGTGELGTFFFDSAGNLIGLAQPIRGSA